MTESQILAGVHFPSKFPIDRLLLDVIEELRARGLMLGGVVQVVSRESDRHVDNVHLRDLSDGSEVPILQDLGRDVRGCRLNPEAVAEVAGRLERTLDSPCDLLVINRFGRGESEGHGLRDILSRAVAGALPVLVAVREDYGEAWADFHGGLAVALPPDREAILEWAEPLFAGKATRSKTVRPNAIA